ncbi:hypothetical protein [Pseudomonas sp. IPO3774]|uniref:hypothetical protein n=1 Tax=Pseudomonas sp. IPO3774 TaxID=2738826 RepID=UPI0015A17C9C|nr:hypothetical protein [Pseudomonas sp. IPO3774]NWD64491.1 hypothetical protein [Pseudomonas sp. IPO3774]
MGDSEVLLQSTSISTRYISDAQQREIERLRNRTMKETKRALAGKLNLRPAGLLELAIAEKISASCKKEAVTKGSERLAVTYAQREPTFQQADNQCSPVDDKSFRLESHQGHHGRNQIN